MLRTDSLEYELPEELIATHAVEPRDSARLLVVSRSNASVMEHGAVRDLPRFLRPGDIAVFNRSKVLRARIRGVRKDTGGAVEGLFLEHCESARGAWRMLLRSNGRLREGFVIRLSDAEGKATDQSLRLIRKDDDAWIVEPEPRVENPAKALERVGFTPLPPYILHARKIHGENVSDAQDRVQYQTVYAAESDSAMGDGSVAAPTAGLHFTDRLLSEMADRGVREAFVELQVGAGTFKPVQTETVEAHPMHRERCAAPPEIVSTLQNRGEGRLFAVGTTSARTLESIPEPLSQWESAGWTGSTQLLITPGYSWRFVDGMVTNFHLPRSTLLAMVGALFPDGVERLLEIYRIAIAERYRFYSYGDAMLILP